MNIAVIQFPGSNCERETELALRRAGMTPVEFLWNQPAEQLAQMNGFVIVGGFSYEDRSRAGIIAALDPIMNELKIQSQLGKPILGICNGAQILVEAGLVPGVHNHQLAMALTENKRIVNEQVLGTGFYNAWVNLKINSACPANAFTRSMQPGTILKIPAAHAQGRFVMSAELLNEMEQYGLNAFQYCDEEGQLNADFPTNPNGSMANTAAVINKSGNVMAIMPHPERTEAGDVIFNSMRDYILEDKQFIPQRLNYVPQPTPNTPYKKEAKKQELLVQLIITDNEALTVQNTLSQLGLKVEVSRMVHWQIEGASRQTLEQIKNSGVLYNDKKEFIVPPFDCSAQSKAYLVCPKENIVGLQKTQVLKKQFGIAGFERIDYGVLWIFKTESVAMDELNSVLLNSHIIFNPYAHECYDYE